MTIDEAKKILPPELKYPLPDETIDKLLETKKITIALSDSKCISKHYAMLAALIELKERREQEDKEDEERALEIEREDWGREE